MVADKPKHEHRFAELSGYCDCGLRDDGRLIVNGIEWQPGYRHNPELEELTKEGTP